MKIGSQYQGNGVCEFTLWAPSVKEVAVQVVSPDKRAIPMRQEEQGYWKVKAEVEPRTQYFYKLDGETDRPDPASHYQPRGVHEASEVVDHSAMKWHDAQWTGIPLEEMIIYELHVGTFTPEGTFEAIIPRLGDLKLLGVNAIEIMPISQFPGDRNWGYDGVYPFASQSSYGGPYGLKKLIDAAHQAGVAVILDVVYNHFGPEGNYTSQFGPYFTDTYHTPWGSAINFDNAYSYGVRNFVVQNVLHWFENYHFDALRLDAIHAIYDLGAKHILREVAENVAALSETVGRTFYLIAESDLDDVRVIRPIELGGYGMDAQWSDGFHHSLHTLLTQENIGYYKDYVKAEQLAKAYTNFVYTWDYSPFRQRYHGSDASDRPGQQFVVCAQNHDQVGNRMLGERLTHLTSFEALKLAAGALLLSPYVPMLFMGEEYGESAPFLYFVSHTDPDLVEAVRQGRKREFADFHLEGEYDDPQSPNTFEKSKLHWEQRQEGNHQVLWQLYQHLIHLRRTVGALKHLDKEKTAAWAIEDKKLVFLHRWSEDSQIYCIMNFSKQDIEFTAELPDGSFSKILDSSDSKWLGSDSTLPDQLTSDKLTIKPQSFAVYQS
ncbi:MAG: malto-oligosyltrehalose trehalohydrolase [Cyanophyceae cyanobacterium]